MYLIHFAVIFFALNELSLPNHGSARGTSFPWSALVYPVSVGYA